jgi:hypothetical protein
MKMQISAFLVGGLLAVGCSTDFWGGGATGAAVGAGGAGAGYELNARKQLKRLDEDLKAGRITQAEYDIRKDQVQKGSLVY